MAAEYLTRKYGDGMVVSYHDLTDPFAREQSQVFIAQLVKNRWTLPAVLLNGQLVLEGYLDFAALVSTVVRKIHEHETIDSKLSPQVQ